MTQPALPKDFRWSALIPELVVSDIAVSLDFWNGVLGFRTAYDRPEAGFAFLHLGDAQVMLAAREGMARWTPAELTHPFGRGMNLQITTTDLEEPLMRLRERKWPLHVDLEEMWYRAGDVETGVRQFAVADPDGYLVRLSQPLGQRSASRGTSQ